MCFARARWDKWDTRALNSTWKLTASCCSGSSEPDWLAAEGPPPKRRDRMPQPAQTEKSYSLWSIIKECIGKDLSRVCLPVYFNEPLSALQKSAEDLEYCELLDKVHLLPSLS